MELNRLIKSNKYGLRLCRIAAGVTFIAFMSTVASAATTLAPLAGTPLDCPSVIAVPGGYRLTQDSTCTGLGGWNETNKFFSLNGFTLTIGNFAFMGDNLTMRNGAVKLNGNFRAFGKAGILSNLSIISIGGPLDNPFGLEAGTDFTVKNCAFSNFLTNALTFYYGDGGGSVKNSLFIGNKTAISIQHPDFGSGILIENNTFVRNGRGVNLYDEDSMGVNNNTIRHNTFQKNGVGINMFAHTAGYPTVHPSLQGNRIVGNRIDRNGNSGFYLRLTCRDSSPIVCSGQNTLVSGNRFSRNGFASGSTSAPDDNDDGMTARAYFYNGPNNLPPGESYPEGLAGVKVAHNHADQNAYLGFDVNGVTDGGGNTGKLNGYLAQCDGVVCGRQFSASGAVSFNALPTVIQSISLETIPEAPFPSDQVSHH
jgi:hypothetical protein